MTVQILAPPSRSDSFMVSAGFASTRGTPIGAPLRASPESHPTLRRSDPSRSIVRSPQSVLGLRPWFTSYTEIMTECDAEHNQCQIRDDDKYNGDSKC